MKTQTAKMMKLPGATLLVVLALASTTALAETDRLTVEDGSNNVKFKVTSDGNVTGNSMSVQQGATEATTAVKMSVKDNAGLDKFVVQANGAVGIGTSSATYPLTIDSSIATAVPAGVGMFVLSGIANKERIEVRAFGNIFNAPSVQGKGAQWANGAPAATKKDQYLISVAGSGHDGNALVIGNKGMVAIRAEEDWTTTAQGTYALFETTTPGTVTRSEKIRVTGVGNLGIGATAPTQKLEVNGGVRINTAAVKPTCDATTRGTFWVTQGSSNDLVEVCAMVSSSLTWKSIW